MECNEIINRLKSMASEKYKENVVKLGIPESNSIGVSTADIRNLAKEVGKSSMLATELWKTKYHEARLLAILVFNNKEISSQKIDQMMSEVISWDLCDHFCKNLIIKRKDYHEYIDQWISSTYIYKKRAAFTLIASAAIHDNKLNQETIDIYLDYVRRNSDSEQDIIKKAASWALREIGKIDYNNNEKALILAHDMVENGSKNEKWVGKDALKEIESVVKVEGRTRLISTKSKMGSL